MEVNDQLRSWREMINVIDQSVVGLLSQRLEICRQVGDLKKKYDIPMMQHSRVDEVLNRCAKLANEANLSEAFVKNLYRLIIEEACRLETEIIEA